MAKSTIDIFPLFKQSPAVIGTVTSPREMLIYSAENYGPKWYDGKAHQNFQRGTKEDIQTQSILRIRAGDRVASPMSVVSYVTEGETRRSTHPKLERRRV